MSNFPLIRNYTTGWCTLRREDAINGLVTSLSERKGVKNISVLYCSPAQLEGDKGYEMQVCYQEDLDETFEFPENLEKVIFLDTTNSSLLPYNVETLAKEMQAGIVIVTPSLKDEYYDVGNIFPRRLVDLMENARKYGVQIVGVTPSISAMKDYDIPYSEMIEYSINGYLREHPSIQKFIIVSKEDMKDLSPYLMKGDDISWDDEKKARDILNGKVLVKKEKMNIPFGW